MPKRCSACEHEQRVDLDAALLSGEPTRAVSDRFDGLTHPTVKAHRRSGHPLVGRTPRRRTSPHNAESLLKKIEANLEDAEAVTDLRLAVLLLPHGERRLLVAALRRRAGRVAEHAPVSRRVAA